MINLFENLLDNKGIISTIVFLLVVLVLLSLITQLQQSPLGQNERANKTLEEGKKSISIITESYFITSGIVGVFGLITFFILYKKF